MKALWVGFLVCLLASSASGDRAVSYLRQPGVTEKATITVPANSTISAVIAGHCQMIGWAYLTVDYGSLGQLLTQVGDCRNDGVSEDPAKPSTSTPGYYHQLFTGSRYELRTKPHSNRLRRIKTTAKLLFDKPHFLIGSNDGLTKTVVERRAAYVPPEIADNPKYRKEIRRLTRGKYPLLIGVLYANAAEYAP